MEQSKYDGKTKAEKIDLLKANCRQAEMTQVQVFFSEDDLNEMKSRLSEISIEKNENECELREITKGVREKIKDNTTKIKGLLGYLKNKYEYQQQEVYHFDDQENGVMITYNGDGELIATRKLRPQERQTRIINLDDQKTA